MADSLHSQILTEHHRSEFQRLEQGQAGCGCSDCQDFYNTLDLSKYGKRVLHLEGFIYICAAKSKAEDTPQNGIDGLSDAKDVITTIPCHEELLPLSDTTDTKDGIMLHRRRGRPRKPTDEPVCRMTEWRRRKEQQGVLL